MLFLLLCKSGENKEVPNIQSINQSINGEHPPPACSACSPRTRGRASSARRAAGAAAWLGLRPRESRRDPRAGGTRSGSPSRQGSGGVSRTPRGEPRCAPRPEAEGLGPGVRTSSGTAAGAPQRPGRGRGRAGGGEQAGGRGRLSPRPAAARPGRPNQERSSRTPLAQRILGRERRIL